jgi:hypothetical protein
MNVIVRHSFCYGAVFVDTLYTTTAAKSTILCYVGQNKYACKVRKKSTVLLCSTVVHAPRVIPYCIQWNPSSLDTLGTQYKLPVYQGAFLSGVIEVWWVWLTAITNDVM